MQRCRVAVGLLACGITMSSAFATDTQVQGRAIKAHTAFLADDLLEGRETARRGFDIAAAYVAAQFAALGLQPGNSADGFFQTVPLRRASLQPDGVRFSLRDGQREIPLTNGVDVAIDPSDFRENEEISTDLVFVGWGITAPSLGHDDYAGLDVKGKTVVMLEGAPASLPGALRAHYSWRYQKERMAAAHGAVAILAIKSPLRERVSPWELTRKLKPLPAMTVWDSADAATRVQAVVSLGPEIARTLFKKAGRDLDRIYRDSEKKSPRGFKLPMSMQLSRKSIHEDTSSPNVLGILRGTDPAVKDEFVVVAAHLDHVGIGAPVNGDTIYNGAVDNAGGVAIMLEVARTLSAGPAPRRSILFFATTGEEKGLLGSEYFASHPTIPRERIAAAISVDGLMAFHDFRDIVALGADHSTLGEISAAAAKAIDAVHVPDPIPERGNLALSDQYPFLKRGIPVLFPNPGRGNARDGSNDIAAWDAYEQRSYHQPSDDMKLPLRWDVAERWGRYIEGVVEGTANAPQAPQWYEDDPLAKVFAPDSKRAPRP